MEAVVPGYYVLAVERVSGPLTKLPIFAFHNNCSRLTGEEYIVVTTSIGNVPRIFVIGGDGEKVILYGHTAYVIVSPGGEYFDRDYNRLDGLAAAERCLAEQVSQLFREEEREDVLNEWPDKKDVLEKFLYEEAKARELRQKRLEDERKLEEERFEERLEDKRLEAQREEEKYERSFRRKAERVLEMVFCIFMPLSILLCIVHLVTFCLFLAGHILFVVSRSS